MARKMTDSDRACETMRRLGELYPNAHIALDYDDPWHLLVAVILSAQTTDVGVNRVTPKLFARFPRPEDLAGADRARGRSDRAADRLLSPEDEDRSWPRPEWSSRTSAARCPTRWTS